MFWAQMALSDLFSIHNRSWRCPTLKAGGGLSTPLSRVWAYCRSSYLSVRVFMDGGLGALGFLCMHCANRGSGKHLLASELLWEKVARDVHYCPHISLQPVPSYLCSQERSGWRIPAGWIVLVLAVSCFCCLSWGALWFPASHIVVV